MQKNKRILIMLKIILPIQAILFLVYDLSFASIQYSIEYWSSSNNNIIFFTSFFHASIGIAPFVIDKSRLVKAILTALIGIVLIKYAFYINNRFSVLLETSRYVGNSYWVYLFIIELYCFVTNLGIVLYIWNYKNRK